MSLIARIGRQWHPLARLNTMISVFFVFLELIIVLTIFLVPTTLNRELAAAILNLTCVWWLIAFFCLVWVSLNAGWVSWRAIRDRDVGRRNVLLAWAGPILIFILWLTVSDVLLRVAAFRANRDFDNSRSDFLIVCERVYAEGRGSSSIGDNQELGVFSEVDVRLRNEVVYFQLGDDLREYGYVCVQQDDTLPDEDNLYEYEKIDERFYSFQEIENLLTPQPDTPTPFTVPGTD
jgi:hypothetical protein